MVYTVNSCCCGCSLKTGTLIIGVFQAVLSGLLLVGALILLSGEGIYKQEYEEIDKQEYEKAYSIIVGVLIVGCIILASQLLFSSLLIYGANTENPRFLMPWIIYTIVGIVLNLIVTIVMVATGTGNGLKSLASVVLGSLLNVYFIIVVNSFHQQLKNPTQMAIGKNNAA